MQKQITNSLESMEPSRKKAKPSKEGSDILTPIAPQAKISATADEDIISSPETFQDEDLVLLDTPNTPPSTNFEHLTRLDVSKCDFKGLNMLIAYSLAFHEVYPNFLKLVKSNMDTIFSSARHLHDDSTKVESLRLMDNEKIDDYVPDVMQDLSLSLTRIMADIASHRPDFDVRTNMWIPVHEDNILLTEGPGTVLIKDTPVPQLTSCDIHQLHEFYQKIRTLHASGMKCNLRRWINDEVLCSLL